MRTGLAAFGPNRVADLLEADRAESQVESEPHSLVGVEPGYESHATLKSMSFTSYAVNGKYSLITNPPRCARGHWSGTYKLGFSTGSVSKKTSIACTK